MAWQGDFPLNAELYEYEHKHYCKYLLKSRNWYIICNIAMNEYDYIFFDILCEKSKKIFLPENDLLTQ